MGAALPALDGLDLGIDQIRQSAVRCQSSQIPRCLLKLSQCRSVDERSLRDPQGFCIDHPSIPWFLNDAAIEPSECDFHELSRRSFVGARGSLSRQPGCCCRPGQATFFRTQARKQDAVIRSALDPLTFAGIFDTAFKAFSTLAQTYCPPMSEALHGSSLPLGLAHLPDKVANNMERNAFEGDAIHSPCLSFQFACLSLPTFGPF
jgi:hypothetical protein